MGRLVIDGNSVYEIDEECERTCRKNQEWKKEKRNREPEKREKNKRGGRS